MTQRVVGGVTWNLTYNAENRTQSLGSGAYTATYLYDGDGARVGQVAGSAVTYYFMGGAFEVSGTLSGSLFTEGGHVLYYAIAGQRVAMERGGALNYLLTDQLGSSVALLDGSGALLSQQRYLPFGQVRASQGTIPQTDLGFTGQRLLGGSSGLMDYKARFYDSGLGRFLQADSIVPNTGNPQRWNRYSYVSNRPIVFNDPTGQREACGIADEQDDCRPHKPSPRPQLMSLIPGNGSKLHGGEADIESQNVNPDLKIMTRDVWKRIQQQVEKCATNMFAPGCNLLPPGTDGIPTYESSSNFPMQYPHQPDYWVLQASAVVVAGSLTIDRYGNVYFALGGNAGSSIIEGGSVAFVGGWVEDPFDDQYPDEHQMEEFLQGPAVTLSGGAVGGGGISWSPWAESSGDAFASDHFSYEVGAYTPQVGVSATWGFMLFNKK